MYALYKCVCDEDALRRMCEPRTKHDRAKRISESVCLIFIKEFRLYTMNVMMTHVDDLSVCVRMSVCRVWVWVCVFALDNK